VCSGEGQKGSGRCDRGIGEVEWGHFSQGGKGNKRLRGTHMKPPILDPPLH
jgi:hypothetical protein